MEINFFFENVVFQSKHHIEIEQIEVTYNPTTGLLSLPDTSFYVQKAMDTEQIKNFVKENYPFV